jgi:hypothetical protein
MKLPKSRFLLSVQMDVPFEHEQIFHDVYDNEHVPALLEVPGILSVRRLRRAAKLKVALGGKITEFQFPREPIFTALYELEGPEVLISAEWVKAVEAGRWGEMVRPHTYNRRHTLHETITCSQKK